MNSLKFTLVALMFLSTHAKLWAQDNLNEVLHFEANYSIPTTSSIEDCFSTYKLQDYRVKIYDPSENKLSQLSYTLPAEMVGESTEVTLDLIASQDGVKFLSGEMATAKCLGPWKELKCEMRFRNLSINLSSIETKLRDSGVIESEIKIRLQVLARFSGDPIGFTEVVAPL